MNKNDLIASVASSAGLSKSDATRAIESLLDAVTNSLKRGRVDYWVGIESRGFIFASALARETNGGFKMIRKPGKLPNQDNLISLQYDLEYGSDTIEMEKGKGNVIIVDDVYATGGTMQAAKELCIEAGYKVLDTVCLLDIGLVEGHDTKVLLK